MYGEIVTTEGRTTPPPSLDGYQGMGDPDFADGYGEQVPGGSIDQQGSFHPDQPGNPDPRLPPGTQRRPWGWIALAGFLGIAFGTMWAGSVGPNRRSTGYRRRPQRRR